MWAAPHMYFQHVVDVKMLEELLQVRWEEKQLPLCQSADTQESAF